MARLPVVVLSAVAAGAALVGAQQGSTFRAGTNTVSIYATVIDQSGRLVPHLTKGDFEVFDNGKRQDLTVFSNDIQPITVVVMLDRSGSMAGQFEIVSEAAAEFLRHLLPADRVRVGSFSHRVQIDPSAFTSDRDELLRILREDLQPAGPTPLWNATAAAMTALAHEQGRRVVLLFTDGKDNPERPEVSTSFEEIRSRVQIEETMVYSIGLATDCAPAPESLEAASTPSDLRFQGRGGPSGGPGRGGPGQGGPGRGPGRGGPINLPGDPLGGLGRGRIPPPGGIGGLGGGRVGSPGDVIGGRTGDRIGDRTVWGGGCGNAKPDPDLKALADYGGGAYFELRNTDDLAATFTRVADELHHQYLLAFTAPILDGKVHKLEIRVRPPTMTTRARRSYVAAPGK